MYVFIKQKEQSYIKLGDEDYDMWGRYFAGLILGNKYVDIF